MQLFYQLFTLQWHCTMLAMSVLQTSRQRCLNRHHWGVLLHLIHQVVLLIEPSRVLHILSVFLLKLLSSHYKCVQVGPRLVPLHVVLGGLLLRRGHGLCILLMQQWLDVTASLIFLRLLGRSNIVFDYKAIAEDIGTDWKNWDGSPLFRRFTIFEFVAALAAISTGRVVWVELRILRCVVRCLVAVLDAFRVWPGIPTIARSLFLKYLS